MTRDQQLQFCKDDEATIVVEYAHAQGIIQASWNWPFGRKDMEVYGVKGYVIADRNGIRYKTHADQAEELSMSAPPEKPRHDPFALLAAVVRKEIVLAASDPSSLANNMLVMEILEAAKQSAREGKRIKLR